MIFVSTSNGIYIINPSNNQVLQKLTVFRSLEIFGICWSNYLGRPVFASRNRSWLYPFKKKSTSCNLYSVSSGSKFSPELIAKIPDVNDVHQIAAANSYVYLSDTTKNRIVVFDLENNQAISNIDIGSLRKDINHINALHIDKDFLFVGLNNRGKQDSQVLKIRLDKLDYSKHEQRGDLIGEIIELPNRVHTHDIFPFNDDYLVSASHNGVVFKAIKNSDCISGGGWVRGLTSADSILWVGESKKAERKKRHSVELSGALNKYDSVTFEKLGSISLPGAGQVNDLLFVDDELLDGKQ